MDTDFINILINGGGTAIMVFLIVDMRRAQRERDDQIWALLHWLIVERSQATGKVPPSEMNMPPASTPK